MSQRIEALEHCLDVLTAALNEQGQALASHRDGIAQLAKLVPAVQALAEDLAALVEVSGLPTPRSLAAGHQPGGPSTMAGQIVGIQTSIEEIAVYTAAMDAKIRVMLAAGSSKEPWSPSRLAREVDQAQTAAIANVRKAQEAARRAAFGPEPELPPLPSLNGRPVLEVVPGPGDNKGE